MFSEQHNSNMRPIVVVSNRMPVDRIIQEDGSQTWRTSPGGLVTAMQALVQEYGCTWVGWPGLADAQIDPFSIDNMHLHPVQISADEVEKYYEGFSNDTLWPLYHDVISPPKYHRDWWEAYRNVNARFAQVVAEIAPRNSTVWVHDYQLQLVPEMLRELRSDLTIGFFLHIPFPPFSLFAQLPWRAEVLGGLLGADVVGFQRATDAANFRTAVRRVIGAPSHGNMVLIGESDRYRGRRVLAQEFAISTDVEAFNEIACKPEVIARAREIRKELGDPKKVILGVDRLDYTKGIQHRLKAFAELLEDKELQEGEATLVQIATPSRERVHAYQQLRDEIEMTVSRINGDFGTTSHTPVVYLHQTFEREEMVAFFLAADVLAVTALRDGMNLVAKEYVASRIDLLGVLVLSEFTGSAEELRRSILVNPHDIEAMKRAFVRAARMPRNEQRQRMASLRRVVFRNDVATWGQSFMNALHAMAAPDALAIIDDVLILPTALETELNRLAATPEILVACDFDGTLAPLVQHPDSAKILPRAQQALDLLHESPGVTVAIVSGRSLESLQRTGVRTHNRIIAGSHGAELIDPTRSADLQETGGEPHSRIKLTQGERRHLHELGTFLEEMVSEVPGAWVEQKPIGYAVHIRMVSDQSEGQKLLDRLGEHFRMQRERGERTFIREGKKVLEVSIRAADKGVVLDRIRESVGDVSVLYIGDDVTDEDAFLSLQLGDVGVRVGGGKTSAQHVVKDVETVAALLARLAELRTGVVVGTDTGAIEIVHAAVAE